MQLEPGPRLPGRPAELASLIRNSYQPGSLTGRETPAGWTGCGNGAAGRLTSAAGRRARDRR